MKKELKGLFNKSISYGVMGGIAFYKDYRVGDLVVFERKSGTMGKGIIVKRPREHGHDGGYGVMGMLDIKLDRANIRMKVLSYKLVTDEILKPHALKTFDYKERMTKSQIEKALGYSIEIIGEK